MKENPWLLDCNAYGEEHLEYPTVSEGLDAVVW
jgi:hypothetical protein